MVHTVKNLPAMREIQVQFLGWEDPLEKEMTIHSSTLAWKIPWMEEPDPDPSSKATLWLKAQHGILTREYWSGLPFPSPEDLPNPGIEPGAPALQADSLPTEL